MKIQIVTLSLSKDSIQGQAETITEKELLQTTILTFP